MRIDEVDAHAFGPYRDEVLTLSPGMNVIHGPNEAGKSSWFAALYAGLAGQPHPLSAPGAEDPAESAFSRRHRPWSGESWSTGVRVTLQDGSCLRLTHDLGEGTSTIVDETDGTTLSRAELEARHGESLTTDGTLDGTRLLGLDRRWALTTSFLDHTDLQARRIRDPDRPEATSAGTSTADDERVRDAMVLLGVYDRLVQPPSAPVDHIQATADPTPPRTEAELDAAWVRYHETVKRNTAARKAHRSALKDHAQAERAHRRRVAAYERGRTDAAPAQRWFVLVALVLVLEIAVFAWVAQGAGVAIGVVGILGLLLLRRRSGRTAAVEPPPDPPAPPEPPDYEPAVQPAESVDAAWTTVERTPADVRRREVESEITDLAVSLGWEHGGADAERAVEHVRGWIHDRTSGSDHEGPAESPTPVERVARLAPAVEARIRPWLVRVSGGRYVDATLSAEELTVAVTDRDGEVHDVSRLSRGTGEQVFLLLRVALAQVLAGATEESAPIVLDDVTVQSDHERTRALLELLHELSAEHQVVLFTHEQAVVEWARENLTAGTHQVQALVPVHERGGPSHDPA